MDGNQALRPKTWGDFVGQPVFKQRLDIAIESAKARQDVLPHVLLVSGPGMGKTSLARLIAKQLGVEFDSIIASKKEKGAALRNAILSARGVLLIDEIHRLPTGVQEDLLPALEDGYFDLPNAAGVQLPIEDPLTIIGATTELKDLIDPLVDRFPLKQLRFEDYTPEDMAKITHRMSSEIGLVLPDETCEVLGRAAAGTPRNVKSIVLNARDLVVGDPTIVDRPYDILKAQNVSAEGLQPEHLDYIKFVFNSPAGVGIDVLSAHLRLPKTQVVKLELLLHNLGLISYTPKGRILTPLGYKTYSKNKEQN